MLLALLACTPKTDDTGAPDTDGSDDTATAADSGDTGDTAVPLPNYGFEFDGGTYTVNAELITCSGEMGPYTFSGGALRDGEGEQANAYVYFSEEPVPGDYAVTAFQAGELPGPGEAWIGFIDYRDVKGDPYFDDGVSGEVTVSEEGGALGVTWTSTTVTGSAGTLTSAWGELWCTPA